MAKKERHENKTIHVLSYKGNEMKICVVQTRPIKGDIEGNIEDHKRWLDLAIVHGAAMIVFPELSLTGYEPTLAKPLATNQEDGRFAIFQSISDSKQVTIGVGVPTMGEKGFCISMILFQPCQGRQTYSKKYLHVDEVPFFVSGQNFPTLQVNGASIGLAICYELSIPEHAQDAIASGAEVYIASVAKTAVGVEQANKRLAGLAKEHGMPVLLSNCVGPSDDFVSAGNTAVWDRNGILLGQLDNAATGIIIYDTATDTLVAKL